jgi:hypothetical protein
MQKYLIPAFSLVLSITAFFIALRAWLRSQDQKRYLKQSREHWEEIKKSLPVSPGGENSLSQPKTVPYLSFTIKQNPGEVIRINFSGNIDQISDLFAQVIRENKQTRDMIKSAFRKSGKALG